jgi:hypothetical protein
LRLLSWTSETGTFLALKLGAIAGRLAGRRLKMDGGSAP